MTVWLLATTSGAAPLDPADFAEIEPAFVTTGPVTVDTGGSFPTMTIGTERWDGEVFRPPVGPPIAVFVFRSINVQHPVTVSGTAGFALLATNDLKFGSILLANAEDDDPGPGGYSGGFCSDGEGPSGGGADDDGAGGGGFGGGGGDSSKGTPGGRSFGDLRVVFDGGSGGGSGDNPDCPNPRGGGGGGAVELGAGRTLTFTGTIQVLGGDGENEDGSKDWGGGGGAGGGILLHGSAGRCSGALLASGAEGGRGTGPREADGGGGGGGRVVLIGVDADDCLIDVDGGAGADGAPDGGDGAVLVLDADDEGAPDGVEMPAGDDDDDDDDDAEDREALLGPAGDPGCGCDAGRATGGFGLLVWLATAARRRRHRR